jgi:hypothetical protein
MTPSASITAPAQRSLRQTVRMPKATDGVGNALRHIFGAAPGLPADFGALLSRLNKED